LTAACGAGYAFILAIRAGAWLARSEPFTPGFWLMVSGAVCLCWIGATLGLVSAPIGRPGFLLSNGLVLAAWAAVILGIAWHWHRRPDEARLAPLLARLIAACTLALALSAAQVLPALEFIGQSWRTAGITATILYQYSLDP